MLVVMDTYEDTHWRKEDKKFKNNRKQYNRKEHRNIAATYPPYSGIISRAGKG